MNKLSHQRKKPVNELLIMNERCFKNVCVNHILSIINLQKNHMSIEELQNYKNEITNNLKNKFTSIEHNIISKLKEIKV